MSKLENIPFSSLNRWQRVRFLSLALACGANKQLLSSASSNSDSSSSSSSCTSCDCCGKTEEGKDFFTHSFSFKCASRALVDKHYDALAQAMTELNLSDIWAVQSSSKDEEEKSEILPSGLDLIVAKGNLFSFNNNEKKVNLCLICSLAYLSNTGKFLEEENQEEEEEEEEEEKKENEKKQKAWYWNEKYSESYFNAESGDIGAQSDPVTDLWIQPLRNWSENCRFLVGSTALRIAKTKKEEHSETREKFENVANQTTGQHYQFGFNFTPSKEKEQQEEEWDFGCGINRLFSKEEEIKHFGTGFNRTEIVIPPGNESSSNVFALDDPNSIFKTPLSYAKNLFRAMLLIAKAFVNRADGAARNASRLKGETESNLTASLVAAVFSDARRRQHVQTTQQSSQFGGGGAGGGVDSMSMMMNVMMGGGQNSTSASTGMIPAPQTTQQEGDGEKSREEGMSAMLQAALAAAKASSASSSSSQEQEQQKFQPPPPFSIPLSLFEEILVYSEEFGKKMSNNTEERTAAAETFSTFFDSCQKLREKVELASEIEERKLQYQEAQQGEEEEEEIEFEAPKPKPTYIGEFAEQLNSLCS